MKRSRPYRTYPTWVQRESRMLIWSLAVGAVAAAITAGVIYYTSHGRGF